MPYLTTHSGVVVVFINVRQSAGQAITPVTSHGVPGRAKLSYGFSIMKLSPVSSVQVGEGHTLQRE